MSPGIPLFLLVILKIFHRNIDQTFLKTSTHKFTICFFCRSDQNNSISDEELREMLFGNETVESEKVKNTITWIPSYTLESGVGFSNNPLYGPFVQQEATYLETSLEVFF